MSLDWASPRNDVPRMAVVITDGRSQSPRATADSAYKARTNGTINMYAIGGFTLTALVFFFFISK